MIVIPTTKEVLRASMYIIALNPSKRITLLNIDILCYASNPRKEDGYKRPLRMFKLKQAMNFSNIFYYS